MEGLARARDLAWGLGRALCAVCLENKKSARSILHPRPTVITQRGSTRSHDKVMLLATAGSVASGSSPRTPNGVTAQIFPSVNNAVPRQRLDY